MKLEFLTRKEASVDLSNLEGADAKTAGPDCLADRQERGLQE